MQMQIAGKFMNACIQSIDLYFVKDIQQLKLFQSGTDAWKQKKISYKEGDTRCNITINNNANSPSSSEMKCVCMNKIERKSAV